MYKHWWERIASVRNDGSTSHKILTILFLKLKFKQKKDISKERCEKEIYCNTSYSQCGEDILVDFLLDHFFNKTIFNYLDIGAHHHTALSNTRKFYDKGCRGVLIEPDPLLYENISINRTEDICLNCGISDESAFFADFYIIESSVLNTFDKHEAQHCERQGYKIKEVVKIPLRTIVDIFEKYFLNGVDFLSIDTEGYDLKILKSIDYTKYRPKVICAETLEFTSDKYNAKKQTDISEFLISQGYRVCADTYINTIYVDGIEIEKMRKYKNKEKQ